MRGVLRPAAVVLAALLLLTGCSEGTPSTGDKGYVDGKGIITRLAPAERVALREPVEGESLEGDPVTIGGPSERVTVVNVWYHDCPPCRIEAPILAEVSQQLEGEVDFVGINSRDSDPSQGIAFQRTFGIEYPTVWDPDGVALLAFAGTLPPNAVPSTLVIDTEGRVAASIIGEVSSARTLTGLIEDVQGGPGA